MPRILLVEDDPTLLALLRRYLERREYEIAASLSAEEALEIFDIERDALVIADLTLPGMSGEELLIQLRKKKPGLAGILTSGYPYKPQIAEVRFLQKPFLPQALVTEIEKLLKA